MPAETLNEKRAAATRPVAFELKVIDEQPLKLRPILQIEESNVFGFQLADLPSVHQLSNGGVDHGPRSPPGLGLIRGVIAVGCYGLAVKVTTRLESTQVSPQSEPDRFTGTAAFRVLHTIDARTEPPTTSGEDSARGAGTWSTYVGNVAIVRYDPGARSHWHSHSGGQLLYVVDGEGWVQARGEEVVRLGPGDAVSIAPGEVHWHGANGRAAMAQLAVTTGKPTWFEESPRPPD
jgi:quercetin dioxygenase-like cupin family protein